MNNLILRTGRISAPNIKAYSLNGYIPIFICRFMNPLVKVYENSILHFPELAPSPKLLMDSKNGLINWDEYKSRYLEEMSKVNIIESLSKINNIVNMNPEVTAKGAVLLCYCQDRNKCHRSILSDIINSYNVLDNKVVELYV